MRSDNSARHEHAVSAPWLCSQSPVRTPWERGGTPWVLLGNATVAVGAPWHLHIMENVKLFAIFFCIFVRSHGALRNFKSPCQRRGIAVECDKGFRQCPWPTSCWRQVPQNVLCRILPRSSFAHSWSPPNPWKVYCFWKTLWPHRFIKWMSVFYIRIRIHVVWFCVVDFWAHNTSYTTPFMGRIHAISNAEHRNLWCQWDHNITIHQHGSLRL